MSRLGKHGFLFSVGDGVGVRGRVARDFPRKKVGGGIGGEVCLCITAGL